MPADRPSGATRPDHFSKMRSEEAPDVAADEALPRVGMDLVEYLKERFTESFLERATNTGGYAADPNWCHDQMAAYRGNMAVIAHLRNIAEQQLKG